MHVPSSLRKGVISTLRACSPTTRVFPDPNSTWSWANPLPDPPRRCADPPMQGAGQKAHEESEQGLHQTYRKGWILSYKSWYIQRPASTFNTPSVSVTCCCVTNHPKLSGLKQWFINFHSSVCWKSGHCSAELVQAQKPLEKWAVVTSPMCYRSKGVTRPAQI